MGVLLKASWLLEAIYAPLGAFLSCLRRFGELVHKGGLRWPEKRAWFPRTPITPQRVLG